MPTAPAVNASSFPATSVDSSRASHRPVASGDRGVHRSAVERVVGRCDTCRRAVRAEVVPHPVVTRFDHATRTWGPAASVANVAEPEAGRGGRRAPWNVWCGRFGGACGGCVVFRRVAHVRKAVATNCGGACRGAVGPNCDCECGGDNHGAAHAGGAA